MKISNLPEIRKVYFNDPEKNIQYSNNKISNTKYNIWNFLFLNLWEQFGRFMNLYFLLIACLQLWSLITPVNPIATWLPLIIIFAVSAIKEGLDDYRRYLNDKKANEREYFIYSNGNKKKIKSQDIKVGDIIYLESDDEIPCDIVILATSEKDGMCYIQTANIDGETDFKSRQIPSNIIDMDLKKLLALKGIIECPLPNAEIYRFDARMKVNSPHYISLTEKQLLLQATHLRNTEWVYGVVVYTGNETKVGKNKTKPPIKWTKQDKFINRFTIFIFCFQLTLVIIFGIIGDIWQIKIGNNIWYLSLSESESWYSWIIIPLRFLLLNSMMIPISLKVSLDLIKYCYAKFIDWDICMYDEETNIPANATSTALSEDLGQIEFIFSDKTGTLTENKMIFSKCSIQGTIYGDNNEANSALYDSRLHSSISKGDENIVEFFRILALCHTVTVYKKDDQFIYKASSPDEEALVKAAYHFNIIFSYCDNKTMKIDINGITEEYEKLNIFEFNSDRKRMSILLKNKKTGKLKLYTKGADEVILPRIKNQSMDLTKYQLEEFAKIGLRTLCIASKDLTEEEYEKWFISFNEANTSLENRDLKLEGVYNLLEDQLNIIGITAIEDKLQEKVPETIKKLRESGIKIWMLTGDKYNTAVQIAKSCNLISSDDPNEFFTLQSDFGYDIRTCIQEKYQLAKKLNKENKNFSLIIEGKNLPEALIYSQEFLQLSLLAESVICCRVTPHQKAQVVNMIKQSKRMTLAIGDGGNDVSMIQEAHIGVGITGREGLQAARASDYSIGKFHFLQRLLLIHGRYSYIRTAFVSQYSFYKSAFICFIQVSYSFFNGFSGTTFFNTFCLTTYNILFTSLPVIFYVLDKDLPEYIILLNPNLYQETQKGRYLNKKTIISWIFRAFIQAIIIFGITIIAVSYSDNNIIFQYDSISLIVFTSLIIVNTFTIISESKYLTWINHLVIWGTLLIYFLIFPIFDIIMGKDITLKLYQEPLYWLIVLVSVILSCVPIAGIQYYFSIYYPSLSDILRIREALSKKNYLLPVSSSNNINIECQSFIINPCQDKTIFTAETSKIE